MRRRPRSLRTGAVQSRWHRKIIDSHNAVDRINEAYFAEVALVKRQFPNMHHTRNMYISMARQARVQGLRELGIRVAV
jgi:hypothetical protein